MGRNAVDEKWTVVRHSAWAYQRNPQFMDGLEVTQLTTNAELKRVEKANGIVFDSYGEAEDFAMSAMYPDDVIGLIPKVKGTFSDKGIEDRQIYIPVRKVVG